MFVGQRHTDQVKWLDERIDALIRKQRVSRGGFDAFSREGSGTNLIIVCVMVGVGILVAVTQGMGVLIFIPVWLAVAVLTSRIYVRARRGDFDAK